MAGINEYIEQFGGVSFAERPFGAADNLALCQLFYMPYEQVVSADPAQPPVPFSEASYALFQKRGYHHSRLGLMIPKDASVNMMRMEQQPRFASMRIWAVKEVYAHAPAVQFAAGTFLLPDGTAVIIFRGTDDTITGWREDMDIFLNGTIPSYALAVDYLKEIAAHTTGDLILCGHSKGGHLALYAALEAEASLRARIRGIYNNDGPGYADYAPFATEAYAALLPRYHHLVPHSSAVGMMLAHDYDYTAVTSRLPLGPLQHDLSSWQIEEGAVVTRPDVDTMAKITDIVLSDFIGKITAQQRETVGTVAGTLIRAVNIDHLADTAKQLPTAVKRFEQGWFSLPKGTRKEFWQSVSGLPQIVVRTVKNIKEDTIPSAARAASIALGRAPAPAL